MNFFSKLFGWIGKPKNFLVLGGLATCVAFLWDHLLPKPSETASPKVTAAPANTATQSQSQTTTVNVQVARAESAAAPNADKPVPATVVPDPVTQVREEKPASLAGDYKLGSGARLDLSDTSAVELVGIYGAGDKYEVYIAATFWPGRKVSFVPGAEPIDARIDGRLYRVSVRSVADSTVVLRLRARS